MLVRQNSVINRIHYPKKHAFVIYLTIIFSGAFLSVLVFLDAWKIKEQTENLTKNQIPGLTALVDLGSDLSEQERTLYEYYATGDFSLFERNFSRLDEQLERRLQALSLHFPDLSLRELKDHRRRMSRLSQELERNLSSDSVDWKLARNTLAQVSESRQQANDRMYVFEQNVRQSAWHSASAIQQQLRLTNVIVGAYSVVIMLIAAAVGQSGKRYFEVAAKNERLALFIHRNPNPIIRLTATGRVIYFNPAAFRLLTGVGKTDQHVNELVPDDITDYQRLMLEDDLTDITFEYRFGKQIFSCQMNRLPELNQYDLHFIDTTEQHRAQEYLNYQAFHVMETGAWNKSQFQNDILQRIATAPESKFTVCLLELRHYNRLLAAHGVTLAVSLIRCLVNKLNDCIERLPGLQGAKLYQVGEQVLLIMLDGQREGGELVKLMSYIERDVEKPVPTGWGEFSLELDFGASCYPQHGSKIDILFQRARLALDEAIATEHSCTVVYREELGRKLERSTFLTKMLKKALANGEFELHYQPQWSLSMDNIVGIESLVRWSHAGAYVSPAEFIPMAEQTGLIIELGAWILDTAVKQAKQLYDLGYQDLVVAVNISPRQFRHPDFVDQVQQTIDKYALPAANLELEITEGVIMHNEAEIITVLSQLKAIGLQLSIDDFGTGYSSLSYLKQFPLDKLKIDQSFIRDLHSNDEDKIIVRTIVDLGRNLGLKLVAEGVEKPSHLIWLKSVGCDVVQGYYFSKPLRESQLLQFLARPLDIVDGQVKLRSQWG